MGSWPLPLDLEEALCDESILVFKGSYKSIHTENYFNVAYLDSNGNFTLKITYDLGTFQVGEVLRNNQKRTYFEEEDFYPSTNIIINNRCEGGPCYAFQTYSLGQEGIWLVRGRHSEAGEFTLNSSPENPLPLSKQAEVEKIIRNCSH